MRVSVLKLDRINVRDCVSEPARPGDLSADVYQGPNVTIRFTRSDGSVDNYSVNITQRDNSSFTKQKDVSGTGEGDMEVTFYGLTPYKVYDVEIQAQSGNVYSDIRQDSFRVSAERKIRLIFESLSFAVANSETSSLEVRLRGLVKRKLVLFCLVFVHCNQKLQTEQHE